MWDYKRALNDALMIFRYLMSGKKQTCLAISKATGIPVSTVALFLKKEVWHVKTMAEFMKYHRRYLNENTPVNGEVKYLGDDKVAINVSMFPLLEFVALYHHCSIRLLKKKDEYGRICIINPNSAGGTTSILLGDE